MFPVCRTQLVKGSHDEQSTVFTFRHLVETQMEENVCETTPFSKAKLVLNSSFYSACKDQEAGTLQNIWLKN